LLFVKKGAGPNSGDAAEETAPPDEATTAIAEPLTAIFLGKFGAGKSKTICSVANDDTVAEASPGGNGVTTMPKIAF